jgi:hypothetical protein
MCANNVSFNSVADSHEERGEFMTSWFMSYEFILSSARWWWHCNCSEAEILTITVLKKHKNNL